MSAKRKTAPVPQTAGRKRLSHTLKPDGMTLEVWQRALRRSAAVSGSYRLNNLGDHPVYSDFAVKNLQNGNTYRVSIRCVDGSMNYCECNDFKTNGLGTCKHIEHVLHQLEGRKRTAAMLKAEYEPESSSLYVRYGPQRDVRVHIGSAHEDAYRSLFKSYTTKDGVLSARGYDEIEALLKKAKAIDDGFRCHADALDHILAVRERTRRHALLDALITRSGRTGPLKGLIGATLFPYQREGVWFALRAGRCLIADEMGLGKTIQAIAAAEMLKKHCNVHKVLIVCPTSLKYQWKKEIERLTESAQLVVEGMAAVRRSQYHADAFYKIVSYNVVGSDLDAINAMAPDLVILDEAQRIKNWNTVVSRNVKKIASPYAIVLTGTPLENKLEELVSIVQFIDMFKLGPLHQFLFHHQIRDDAGKVVGYKNLNHIGAVLKDILVRRTKREVMSQLPTRMDKNLFVPMTKPQLELHGEYSDAVAKLVAKWKRYGYLDEKDRRRLMINLNLMRMVCDSTYIVDQETRHDTKIAEAMSIVDDALQTTRRKIVIFSQWERMTRLISAELKKRKIGFEYLHGGVPGKQREPLFRNFTTDEKSRVFLSTDAGGVGLNLQAGSLMINLDLPWNPAVLEQRIGRIHRIGQTESVDVINLIAAGTIEERMLGLLSFKSSMAKGILDAGEDQIFMGESKFKQFMKSVESLTQPPAAGNANGALLSEEEERGVGQEVATTGQAAGSGGSQSDALTGLVSQGMSFLSALTEAMKDPAATDRLISSLVQKDAATGEAYVKIPVADERAVGTALRGLAGLLQGLMKQ